MKKVFILLVSALLLFSLSACNIVKEKIDDAVKSALADASLAPVETAPEKTSLAPEIVTDPLTTVDPNDTVYEADMDVKDGHTDLWKEDIPAYVPRFEYGEYLPDESGKLEYNGTAVISLLYKGVTMADLKDYSQKMKDSGYADVSYAEASGNAAVTGTYKKDGVESAILMSLDTGADKCTLVITVTQK